MRRLNVAAALLHRPSLLLCDEPTVGVDPQSRNALFDLLHRLNREGMTIIYSTHYMEEASRLCSRIGIIDHGKISAATSAPAGARVMDLSGHTVIPGLVGMHEHLFYPSGGGIPIYNEQAFSFPRLYLASGVTTARTAGSLEPGKLMDAVLFKGSLTELIRVNSPAIRMVVKRGKVVFQ